MQEVAPHAGDTTVRGVGSEAGRAITTISALRAPALSRPDRSRSGSPRARAGPVRTPGRRASALRPQSPERGRPCGVRGGCIP